MRVVLAGDIDAAEWLTWQGALAEALPEAQWLTAEQARQAGAGDVRAAVVANPPPGSLQGLRGLQLIQSLWAGVDRLLADATLPREVPIARMVDPMLGAAMAETALWATLALHRGFFAYQQRQREGLWRQHLQRRAEDVGVLVLGRGEMGRAVAQRLRPLGYRLTPWGLGSGPPEALWAQLESAEIVINLLPLTPATRGLIDARFLAAMSPEAALVNLGRGGHVVDADLLAALDAGQLRHAVLDVFQSEPLPPGHRYWSHPRVTVLPHAAALTDHRSASAVVATNLRALREGRPIAHLVDRGRGY